MNEEKKSWGGKRENSGRHAKGYKCFSVRVTPQFAEKVRQAAEQSDMSAGEYIEKHLTFN